MRLRAPKIAALAAFGVLSLVSSAAAGALPGPGEPPKAELATTGDHSELLKAIPISKKPNMRERVAMSLGPEELRRIEPGQRIRVSGEIQFSTTCVDPGPRCIGSNYSHNPTLSARIVLAASPRASAPAFGLSPATKQFCKQRRPNRNHHCTLAIPNAETTIADPATLPCPVNGCYVNMIVSAFNKKAKPANRVVLGADRPDGSVKQDKGRLNAIQANADVAAPIEIATDELVNTRLPTTEGKKEKRRVVHSVPISAPRKGEVISFDASFLAGITGLRFNTFVSARVIVADSPTSTDPSGVAKSASLFKGDATESNGFNCTLGASGYANPCTVVKAGATRITRDVVDEISGAGVLYVNVVAAAKPLLTEKVKGPSEVSLALADGLTVTRYALP